MLYLLTIGDSKVDLVAAVKAHALANYEKGGWDYVVECYSDDDIKEVIGGARTPAGAIKKMAAEVGPRAAYRADICGA